MEKAVIPPTVPNYISEFNANFGKIFVIVGQSSAGKSAICKDIAKEMDIKKVISCTSRPPRDGEVDGIDYHFLPKEDFNEEDFIALETYQNWHYGVRKSDIPAINNCAIVLTPSGFRELKKTYGERVVGIYIMAPHDNRAQRYLDRDIVTTEIMTELIRRFEADEKDFFEFEYEADYLVRNHQEYRKAVNRVKDIILHELGFGPWYNC